MTATSDSLPSISPSINETFLPYFTAGPVVKGFGRGSKDLGIPTANFPDSVVENLPPEFPCGIYFGWCSVNDGPIFKMVLSVGWNPFYKNIKKSMETHILHEFSDDFYESVLKVVVVGFIRPEMTFSSLDELISAIKDDVATAKAALERPEYQPFQDKLLLKDYTIPLERV